MLLPKSSTSNKGTHVITWPDQKGKEVPVIFPTQAEVTDDEWGSKAADQACPKSTTIVNKWFSALLPNQAKSYCPPH